MCTLSITFRNSFLRSASSSGEVGSGTAEGIRSSSHSAFQGDSGSTGPGPASIHFVDDPTYTSGQAITYKIQARDNGLVGLAWWCNAGVNDSNTGNWPRTISGFTIQELL